MTATPPPEPSTSYRFYGELAFWWPLISPPEELFSREDWPRLLAEAGFDAEVVPEVT